MNQTVNYTASTQEISHFFTSMENAFEQNFVDWDEEEQEKNTKEALKACAGMFEALLATPSPVEFPAASPAASPATSPTAAAVPKKEKVVEKAVSLLKAVAFNLFEQTPDEEQFNATVGEVSIVVQRVNSNDNPKGTATQVVIANSKASLEFPKTFCADCLVAFAEIGYELAKEVYDNHEEENDQNVGHRRILRLISRVFEITFAERGVPGQRRRTLQEDDFSELTECSPFQFTIPIEGNLNFSNHDGADEDSVAASHYLPVCQFWDTENSTWSQSGCWVSSFTETTVTCACTHLTSFSGSADDFIPSANVKALWTWRSLNLDNLMEHPTVFLSILGVLCLFISICLTTPDKHNKPMLAFEDSIFESYKNRRFVGRHTSLELTEIKYLDSILPTNSKMMIGMGIRKVFRGAIYAMVKLQMALFILYLRNEHALLSVFQRSAGTNYTKRQRISCFFVYLCTLMAVSAVFYGVNQQGVSIITASAIMSVVAVVPGKVFKKFFSKSKPKEIKSRKITQMIFHLKPDLELIESSRSQTYKKVLDMVSNKEEEIKWETLRRFQSNYNAEQSAKAAAGRGEIDWNQMTLMNRIRNRLLDQTFPYPHFMKKITWTLLSGWCLAMIVIALHYGIQFDLLYEMVEDKAVPDCWENNFREKLNNRFTEIYIENKQNSAATDYGWDYLTDSRAWLISLCGSLAFSTFLWQPITIWLMTWMKLWAFSHNLKLDSGPSNMCHLMAIVCCCRCCGCLHAMKRRQEKKEKKRNNQHFGDAVESETGIRDLSQPIQRRDGVVTATVSEIDKFRITDIADRPLDVYQFYGSRELLVNDVDTDIFVQHFPIDDEKEGNDFSKAHGEKHDQKEIKPLNTVSEEQDEEFSDEAPEVSWSTREEEEDEKTEKMDERDISDKNIAEVERKQEEANDASKDENQEMAKQGDRWKAKPHRTRHISRQKWETDQSLESVLESMNH